MTFPKAYDIHECAKKVPNDKYLIETNSPFLAPFPTGVKEMNLHLLKMLQFHADLRSTELTTVAKSQPRMLKICLNLTC